MTSLTSAAVFGSTGHSGQYILASLLATESVKTVYTFSRRAPKIESPKLAASIERDNSSVSNKWKIDHDLNVELAKAAREAGVKTYVFISGAGARSALGAYVPDMKMKRGVEETIEKLGFDHAVILRPGMILGRRETPHPIGPLLNSIIYGVGSIAKSLQDKLGQEAEVVGKAAVQAAQTATEGKAPSKVWVIEGSDLVKLGNSVQ
ncbi:hypothetical protein EKO27_g220 [Xylaria grammica]|uniref:NAD(P)-binding domain-containing protein n=1 Tax=Xylaria grammica TaxID=363999 RepID=A0A439DKN9_9PEZI|nr:hypothetical protein EKO27_g220 [Xylaria grammica]